MRITAVDAWQAGSAMKRIHVVAAVIHGDRAGREGEILISRRPDHLHQGGKWEFPGGKVESDEAVEDALNRELKEELDIETLVCRPLIQIQHDYPDKSVFLDVWDVLEFAGCPKGVEGQQIEWVPSSELDRYEFPAANVPILEAVKLPDHYWITPDMEKGLAEFLRLFEHKLHAGARLIQLRAKSLLASELVTLSEALLPLKLRFDFRLLINGDCYERLLAADLWRDVFSLFDGVHLTDRQLREAFQSRQQPDALAPATLSLFSTASDKLLAASCHNAETLAMAEAVACHFATLSPIKPTLSHPGEPVLSSEEFGPWIRQAKLPVYALGGLGDNDITDMKRQGFQGAAGISQLFAG